MMRRGIRFSYSWTLIPPVSAYCAIAKVIERPDISMNFEMMKTLAGRNWVFLPMPGDQM